MWNENRGVGKDYNTAIVPQTKQRQQNKKTNNSKGNSKDNSDNNNKKRIIKTEK